MITTSKIVVALVVWGAGLSGFAQPNTLPSAGNVGIGTTNPSFARLQVGTPSGSDTFGSGFDVAGKSQVEVSNNGITEVLRLSNYSGASAGIGPRLTFASNNNELTAAITGVFDGGTNGQLRFDTETYGVLTEKLRVTSGGNVGIGTTSPGAKLEVIGGSSPFGLIVEGDGFSANARIALRRANATGASATGNIDWIGNDNAVGARIGVNDDVAGSMAFKLGGGALNNTRLFISSAGNVGIGTTSPANTLDVKSTGSSTVIGLETPTQAADALRLMDSDGSLRISNGTSANLVALVGLNVGIGTTNPTQKLSVNGTVRAKEVVVDNTGWSDYVFDERYKLKALSEVEAYVKAEKHLPGIPSAQDVAEHGVSMGEMQSKLLAKIEELTLHQIEQEKRLIAQQNQLATQQEEIRELKATRR